MHKQMKEQHVTRYQVLWRPISWRIQGGECKARFAAFRKGQEKPVSPEPEGMGEPDRHLSAARPFHTERTASSTALPEMS